LLHVNISFPLGKSAFSSMKYMVSDGEKDSLQLQSAHILTG
jgi:hypothetical protein